MKILHRKLDVFFVFLFILIVLSCGRHENPVEHKAPTTASALVDAAILDELVTEINKGSYGEVHSVLIARDGTLAFERYFRGYNRERLHPLYSVTKSVMSALIGIGVDRQEIGGVDTNMLDFFQSYIGQIANLDSLKETVTLEHLLTMTAGFAWDEWTYPYDDPRNDISKMYVSGDWVKYVLDLPMSDVPGTNVVYNSGVSMLLSALLTNVTGQSAKEYASRNLFGRLDVTNWMWESPPYSTSTSIGGWGLHMRPVDMIAFGQLYLQLGRWNGEQIVSEDWVRKSTAPYGNLGEWYDYGYQWWRYSDRVIHEGLLETNDVFIAVGRGGQYIWVVPQYNTVVVSTAWNDNNGKSSSPMFMNYILPAVKGR
jgi:CubicO group peptidase (beta-lactamase class C family)